MKRNLGKREQKKRAKKERKEREKKEKKKEKKKRKKKREKREKNSYIEIIHHFLRHTTIIKPKKDGEGGGEVSFSRTLFWPH